MHNIDSTVTLDTGVLVSRTVQLRVLDTASIDSVAFSNSYPNRLTNATVKSILRNSQGQIVLQSNDLSIVDAGGKLIKYKLQDTLYTFEQSVILHNDKDELELGLELLDKYIGKFASSHRTKVYGKKAYGVGSQELVKNNPKRIYPNPAQSIFKIEDSRAGDMLTILDLQGRVLLQKKISGIQEEINIEFLEKGVYLVLLENAAGRYTSRLVKE
jgi:hypothetical protein